MYFRNNVSKSSVFVLLTLIMCSNLKAMNGLERVVHINRATAYAGDSIETQNIITPAVTMNNINVNPDDFSDRNAGFFKNTKNALRRGFFYGISSIGASLVTFAANAGLRYLVLSRANSQKANESSVTLEQLILEAQLINSYEKQNHYLSSSSNDKQYQEFQESLREAKKVHSDHIIEYFKQNQKQKDTESKNKTLSTVPSEGTASKNDTTSLPTGIPTPAA